MIDKSIIYVAYSPYENQGKILDYILESFPNVYLFSVGHHNLGKKEITNKLSIYRNKKKIDEIDLYHFSIPSNLVFLLLPIRSLITFIQVIWNTVKIKRKHGNIEYYFAVNGYAAWIGIVLRNLKLVRKTIYWVCDYYPKNHKSKVISVMRWLYWLFEERAVGSDRLVFHNDRLVKVWIKHNVLPKNYKPILVPIGTDALDRLPRKKYSKKVKLVFLGVLKISQGLDFIFDSAELLNKHFPGLKLDIIGPGPDLNYFKNRAAESGILCDFHGYISDPEIDGIIKRSDIGIAPYMTDPSNVSYYGDPGKIKRYISLATPVIATNIHQFSNEIEKHRAGVLVEYGNMVALVNAIKRIKRNFNGYCKSAWVLNKKYYYKNIYSSFFRINKII